MERYLRGNDPWTSLAIDRQYPSTGSKEASENTSRKAQDALVDISNSMGKHKGMHF